MPWRIRRCSWSTLLCTLPRLCTLCHQWVQTISPCIFCCRTTPWLWWIHCNTLTCHTPPPCLVSCTGSPSPLPPWLVVVAHKFLPVIVLGDVAALEIMRQRLKEQAWLGMHFPCHCWTKTTTRGYHCQQSHPCTHHVDNHQRCAHHTDDHFLW
jgi:hypothetical protein